MKTLNNFFECLWYGRSIARWPALLLLLPFSLVFFIATLLRKKKLVKKQSALPVPVVVVGNIAVGGTGKTPLLCALAAAFIKRGKTVGIVSRGYGGSFDGTARQVLPTDTADVVGDEPLLLVRATQCMVVIGHDRTAAVQYLLQQHTVDVVLSDDGLQHYTLSRKVEVAVLDAQRGVGNGLCLPAGPLREPPSRLQSVDFVVVNGATATPPLRAYLPEQQTIYVSLSPVCWVSVGASNTLPLDALPTEKSIHAVAGIGNPQRFFNTLRNMGYTIIEHIFPDHHIFIPSDIVFSDELTVVMTEKDAVKCAAFSHERCYALRVAMELPDVWVDAVLQKALNH